MDEDNMDERRNRKKVEREIEARFAASGINVRSRLREQTTFGPIVTSNNILRAFDENAGTSCEVEYTHTLCDLTVSFIDIEEVENEEKIYGVRSSGTPANGVPLDRMIEFEETADAKMIENAKGTADGSEKRNDATIKFTSATLPAKGEPSNEPNGTAKDRSVTSDDEKKKGMATDGSENRNDETIKFTSATLPAKGEPSNEPNGTAKDRSVTSDDEEKKGMATDGSENRNDETIKFTSATLPAKGEPSNEPNGTAKDRSVTSDDEGKKGMAGSAAAETVKCINVTADATVTADGTDNNAKMEGSDGIIPGDKNFNQTQAFVEDGRYCYTDPSTNRKYQWNDESNTWELKDSTNYVYEGDKCFYVDKANNKSYQWDGERGQWKEIKSENSKGGSGGETEEDEEDEEDRPKVKKLDMSKGTFGFENDKRTYIDPTDGSSYFWDREKRAWFPNVDEEFMARYQMNYGFVDNASTSKSVKETSETIPGPSSEKVSSTEEPTAAKRKAEPAPPSWFELDEARNTKVYVSNLPCDITEQEFVDLMQKFGIVSKNAQTGKMNVKLYTEAGTNQLKGDALCTYIKKESVDLALKLLDGSDFRGRKIKVEKAKFSMKGDHYDPSLKPKKLRRKDKEKMKKMQEKLFDWRPDRMRGERAKYESVVILKNLFEPAIFDDNLGLILEYQQDIRDECQKCGAVKRVVIHDKHQDGVAQIWFKEAEAADACIKLLNNRWFGQRKVTAETWDGKTKYKVEEKPEEREARLKKWENYLESNKEKTKPDDGNESDSTRSSGDSGDDMDDGKGRNLSGEKK